MKPWPQPSGLSSRLPFTVNATWTPEQALAVWDLLDNLRDRVWTRYGNFGMMTLQRKCPRISFTRRDARK